MPHALADDFAHTLARAWQGRAAGIRVGIDTVLVSGIEASLAAFGERFMTRLFTPHEIETASATPARRAERLAARFAAKEAAIKAFDLAEAGIDWRHIEVCSDAAGRPRLALHGRAAERAQRLGSVDIALSLSHDGDQACAVVAALISPATIQPTPLPA